MKPGWNPRSRTAQRVKLANVKEEKLLEGEERNEEKSPPAMRKSSLIENSKSDHSMSHQIQETADPVASSRHRRAPALASDPKIIQADETAWSLMKNEERIIIDEGNSSVESLDINGETLKQLRIRKSKTMLSRIEQFKDRLNPPVMQEILARSKHKPITISR